MQKIDEKYFCKKYRTNVCLIIKEWKKGLSDADISKKTGIDPIKLQQIKTDIELAHRRLRIAKKKETDPHHTVLKRHIFLSPLT